MNRARLGVGLCFMALGFSLSLANASDGLSDEALCLAFARGVGYAQTFQIALGDLDGDGDLDAVFANMHAASELWMNDGTGRFLLGPRLTREGHGIGIGDLDGDGDLDLFLTLASSDDSSRVYFNDGLAHFTLSPHDLGDRRRAGNSAALVDLDGDGDLDANVYYADRWNALYLNDGTGRFDASAETFQGFPVWGDVDGDGDIDVMLQRPSGTSEVMLNAGDGTFMPGWRSLERTAGIIPGSGALGDVDGDGDLDYVLSHEAIGTDMPIQVFLNDGQGSFDRSPETQMESPVGRLVLGDLNGDGLLDVFIGGLVSPGVVGLNAGGVFHDSGLRIGDGTMAGQSAIGDLDGDGSLDLFVSVYGQGGPNLIWLNQQPK